jgi:hypothetical protein
MLGIIGACFGSVPAVGTTLIALSLEDLTLDSDYIVTGYVLDSTSFLNEGRLFTLHRIRTDRILDDSLESGEIIEIVTAGGHSEWFSQRVFGAPELEVGGQYLLFLKRHGVNDIVRPIGMSQGAYPVIADPTTRTPTAMPSCTGARLVQRYGGASGRFEETTPWLTEGRSLDEIVEEVRAIRGIGR